MYQTLPNSVNSTTYQYNVNNENVASPYPTVPNLKGLDEAGVKKLLANVGFVLQPAYAPSQNIPAGQVIEWTPTGADYPTINVPAGGEPLPPGAEITVTFSTGLP